MLFPLAQIIMNAYCLLFWRIIKRIIKAVVEIFISFLGRLISREFRCQRCDKTHKKKRLNEFNNVVDSFLNTDAYLDDNFNASVVDLNDLRN